MAKLNVLSSGSTVLTDFTEGITKAGILITSGYTGQTPDNYLPGIFWSNNNISQNLPKAGIWVKQNGGTDIYFGTSSDYTQGLNSRVVFDQRGNVGIGKDDPSYKLDVCGTIRSQEWIVETFGCDFVFDENYKRMSYEEKDKWFKEKKHLPGIAPAKESDAIGMKAGATLSGIIMNTEENSLDIIDLYKQINELKKQNELLQNKIDELKLGK